MRTAELSADHTYEAACRQAKQTEQDPTKAGEQRQERTAQVQTQRELENNEGDRAVAALPEGFAQNDAGSAGVEAIVDLKPKSDQEPGERAKAEQQDAGGKVECEIILEWKALAELVGGPKTQGGQRDIGET